MLVYINSC